MMPSPIDPLMRELEQVADVAGAVLVPERFADALDRIVEAAAIGFDAQAASIAVIDGSFLQWRAAFGRGSDEMSGLRLPLKQGIAGFVASTGQSLSIGDVRSDARFARDVAERTGYVPAAIECVPIEGGNGDVIGVLQVLDPGPRAADLDLALALADTAASVIATIAAVEAVGGLLLRALSTAARDGSTLAAALRRRRRSRPDDQLLRLALALADARALGRTVERSAADILEDVVELARQGRRR
jgi:signal transduction protein with GAF and PtsI domain